jgi:tetratricopeptide (TPR) repeat protein
MKKILITTTLLFTFACDDPPAPARAPAVPVTAATGLSRLALEEVSGDSALDRRLAGLQAAVKSNPEKLDAWILLGRAWVQKARQANDSSLYRNANACADIALELEPNNPLALNLQGMVLMNDHRFAEARDLAQKILARDPDDVMALGTLADAELELGDFEGAVKATQRMVDLKPNLPSYARAAHLRWLEGDLKSSIEIIRHAIDAGGDQHDREPLAWVLVEAAKMFHHQGDYAGAIAGYDQALAVFPDYAPAMAWKARALLALDRPEEARALAARSYGESALAETAWTWGDAAAAAGKSEEAAAAYARVVQLGKQGERRALALFWASRNEETEQAIALAKQELASRGDIHTWDAYAWALYRGGRIAEAKEAIEKATRLGTKDARLLFHLGAIMMAAGDEEAGRKKIGEALALEPSFDPTAAREARRMLSRS